MIAFTRGVGWFIQINYEQLLIIQRFVFTSKKLFSNLLILFSKYSHSVSATLSSGFISTAKYYFIFHFSLTQIVSLVWLIWLNGNLPRFKHHEVIILIMKKKEVSRRWYTQGALLG